MTSAPSTLPASSNDDARTRRGLVEQRDNGRAAQRGHARHVTRQDFLHRLGGLEHELDLVDAEVVEVEHVAALPAWPGIELRRRPAARRAAFGVGSRWCRVSRGSSWLLPPRRTVRRLRRRHRFRLVGPARRRHARSGCSCRRSRRESAAHGGRDRPARRAGCAAAGQSRNDRVECARTERPVWITSSTSTTRLPRCSRAGRWAAAEPSAPRVERSSR